MPQQNPFDPGLVRELAKLLAETDLSEIEVEKGDLKIRVARQVMVHAPVPVAPTLHVAHSGPPVTGARIEAAPGVSTAAVDGAANPGMVRSPMVGTAYRRQSPEAKPFIELGNTVKAGDRILLIEAMKTFNDIVATRSGVVTQILVEDGQPVEFGQPLVVIE